MEIYTLATTKKDKKSFLLRMEPTLHLQLRQYALSQGKSLNEVLVGWIEEKWKKQPERKIYEQLHPSKNAS